MIRVSSAEFDRETGRYTAAASVEPVVVEQDGLDVAVLISADEYRRLKGHDRQVFPAGELPPDWVEAVRSARVDPRHAHLDALIADWKP